MTEAEELKLIAMRHRWAYEELVFSEKMIEWNGMCFLVSDRFEESLYLGFVRQAEELMQTVQAMYTYLSACYGGRTEVLKVLRGLLSNQRERRKTWLIEYK